MQQSLKTIENQTTRKKKALQSQSSSLHATINKIKEIIKIYKKQNYATTIAKFAVAYTQ